jgi:glycosyltransferase involved in cell wall biosynthesis
MTSPIQLSAVLPCHEEAVRLPEVLERLERALAAAAEEWEVVLVASLAAGDGTPKLAERLASGRDNRRVVLQAADDMGYGRALGLGIAAARYPWLLLTDADGQFDHGELGRFTALAGQAQVVAGFRARRRDSRPRRLAGRAYTLLVTRLLGLSGVDDLDCAFKLVRRDCIGTEPLSCRTGVVNAEILKRATERGARIVSVPVTHRARTGGRSRFETGLGRLPRPLEVMNMAADLAGLMGRRLLGGNSR